MLSSATVTPPAGYEISQTSGSGFSTAPQNILAGVDNTLAGTIYVRFAPTVGGAANGNLVTTGTQAPTANTALTGNGVTPTITITGALTAFTIAALGTPSAEQTYTVSGIVMTTFISVTAPTGFEVSLTTGAGFGANVNTAAPVSGVIAATTIYVRYNPSAGSSHSGNISHVSTPAPTQNLAASGTVTGSGGGGGGGGGGDDGGCATSEHNAPWLALLAAFAVLAISLRRRLA
jgi:hypothetical protein